MVRHRAFASAWVMLLITVLSPVAVSGYLGAAVLAKSRVAPPRPLRGGGASTLAAQLPVVNRQGRPMRCIVTGGSSGIGEAICGEVCCCCVYLRRGMLLLCVSAARPSAASYAF